MYFSVIKKGGNKSVPQTSIQFQKHNYNLTQPYFCDPSRAADQQSLETTGGTEGSGNSGTRRNGERLLEHLYKPQEDYKINSVARQEPIRGGCYRRCRFTLVKKGMLQYFQQGEKKKSLGKPMKNVSVHQTGHLITCF